MPPKRLSLLEHAARTLAVPVDYLDSKLRLNRALTVRDGVKLCDFMDAARVLGLGKELAEIVGLGREWLMTGTEVRDIYGHEKEARDIISGGSVYETVHGEVYQVAPFIRFLVLDPRERETILEGKKRGRIQNKRVRR